MIAVNLVEQPAADGRRTLAIVAVDRVVGTVVERADDRAAPWRLTIKGCCANVRRSSWDVLEQTIRNYVLTRPECFAPPPAPATAWVPAVPALDGVASDLSARGVRVYRAPMSPRAVEPIDPRPVLVAPGREI